MGKGKRRGEPLAPMRCSCAHRPHLPFRARRRSCRRRDGTRVAVAACQCRGRTLPDPGGPSRPSRATRTGPGRPGAPRAAVLTQGPQSCNLFTSGTHLQAQTTQSQRTTPPEPRLVSRFRAVLGSDPSHPPEWPRDSWTRIQARLPPHTKHTGASSLSLTNVQWRHSHPPPPPPPPPPPSSSPPPPPPLPLPVRVPA